jgi:hypothetical protein
MPQTATIWGWLEYVGIASIKMVMSWDGKKGIG